MSATQSTESPVILRPELHGIVRLKALDKRNVLREPPRVYSLGRWCNGESAAPRLAGVPGSGEKAVSSVSTRGRSGLQEDLPGLERLTEDQGNGILSFRCVRRTAGFPQDQGGTHHAVA